MESMTILNILLFEFIQFIEILNSNEYFVYTTKKNYWDALSSCEDLGFTLATIKNSQENDYMNQLIVAAGGGSYVWFGLTDFSHGTYIDSYGNAQTYFNWNYHMHNLANEACVYFQPHSGYWGDHPCNDPLWYACETGPTSPPTDRPTKHPTRQPTRIPTDNPTKMPTKNPTKFPTKNPTEQPTKQPTKQPSPSPTLAPTDNPTHVCTQCIHSMS